MLIAFNKPFGVLSQFTDKGTEGSPRQTLSDFITVPGIYPAGRLDRDSEGLLLLTDDGRLQARIADPKHKMEKTYWAQVEGVPDEAALKAFRTGLDLKDGRTRPAGARLIDAPEGLWERDPPIRYRKSVPDCWLEVTLSEGKNRRYRPPDPPTYPCACRGLGAGGAAARGLAGSVGPTRSRPCIWPAPRPD